MTTYNITQHDNIQHKRACRLTVNHVWKRQNIGTELCGVDGHDAPRPLRKPTRPRPWSCAHIDDVVFGPESHPRYAHRFGCVVWVCCCWWCQFGDWLCQRYKFEFMCLCACGHDVVAGGGGGCGSDGGVCMCVCVCVEGGVIIVPILATALAT